MTDEANTLAVVAARLDDVRTDIAEMRTEVRQAAQHAVSRGEWGQRNEHVNSRLQELGREIGQLRTELASRRAPWWSVAAVLVAAAALVWSVLGPVITH